MEPNRSSSRFAHLRDTIPRRIAIYSTLIKFGQVVKTNRARRLSTSRVGTASLLLVVSETRYITDTSCIRHVSLYRGMKCQYCVEKQNMHMASFATRCLTGCWHDVQWLTTYLAKWLPIWTLHCSESLIDKQSDCLNNSTIRMWTT